MFEDLDDLRAALVAGGGVIRGVTDGGIGAAYFLLEDGSLIDNKGRIVLKADIQRAALYDDYNMYDVAQIDADTANVGDLKVTGDLVMYEGTQKYYAKITSGTLAAVGAYLIDLTADEHVTVEIKDSDDAVYEDGDEVLVGAALTITLTFEDGYEKDTFTVNTSAKTSPASHTVGAANVAIVVTSKASQ